MSADLIIELTESLEPATRVRLIRAVLDLAESHAARSLQDLAGTRFSTGKNVPKSGPTDKTDNEPRDDIKELRDRLREIEGRDGGDGPLETANGDARGGVRA